MSLSNQIPRNRLMPLFAAIGVCLVALTSGCCGLGGGCGVGGYGGGPVIDAGCGGACGAAACGGPGVCHDCRGLKNLLYPLISPRLACGAGCGQVYWNEWASDPPDCCDPCGPSGCYVGAQTVCTGPPLIVSAIHCVGRGVSDLLGAILGGIGCGPCELLTCGGCGSCGGGAIIDAGCGGCAGGCDTGGCSGGCAGGCSGGCAATSNGQTIVHENPNGAQFAAENNRSQQQTVGGNGLVRSATHQIRANHGRSPHRAFSRRMR